MIAGEFDLIFPEAAVRAPGTDSGDLWLTQGQAPRRLQFWRSCSGGEHWRR